MSAKTMVTVLIEHQRMSSQYCLCGWGKLGASHAEHVADALAAAGFGLMAQAWDEGFEGAQGVYPQTNPYRSQP